MHASELVHRIRQLKDSRNQPCAKFLEDQQSLLIVWGGGTSGRNFIRQNRHLKIYCVVDTREYLHGKTIFGIPIHAPTILLSLDAAETTIVLATEISKQVRKMVSTFGKFQCIEVERYVSSGVALGVKLGSKNEFLEWASSSGLIYVFDRARPGDIFRQREIDILVETDSLPKILEADILTTDYKSTNFFIDIQWTESIGIPEQLPYYPPWVAKKLIDSRVEASKGQWVLTEAMLFISELYQIFAHVGTYASFLKYFSTRQQDCYLGSAKSIDDLYRFFIESEYYPGIDFLRKWAAFTQGDYILEQVSKQSNFPYSFYILRSFLAGQGKFVCEALEVISTQGDIYLYRELSANEVEVCKQKIRGGVWNESSESILGGMPWAICLVRIFDKSIQTQDIKDAVRQKLTTLCGRPVNPIHSADDEIEFKEFCALLRITLPVVDKFI